MVEMERMWLDADRERRREEREHELKMLDKKLEFQHSVARHGRWGAHASGSSG